MAAIITGRPLAAETFSSQGIVDVIPLVSMNTPRPGLAQRAGERHQLALVGQARGHRHAGLAVVLLERGGREADRSGPHGLQHDAAHLGDLGLGGRAPGGVGAEHVGAHRGVADERGDVRHHAAPLHRVEVLGIALEVPAHAGAQRLQRHALDVGQRAQREIAVGRAARRDGEAAVADDDGGHAERGRRRGERIPRELGVVVRVDVHDAGREDQAAGVDALPRGAEIGADRRDASILHGDATGAGRRAETVDDERVVDHEIVHGAAVYSGPRRSDRMAENNTAFVGAIPQNYDRYLGPMLFHGYADDIASRLAVAAGSARAGGRVRDRHRHPALARPPARPGLAGGDRPERGDARPWAARGPGRRGSSVAPGRRDEAAVRRRLLRRGRLPVRADVLPGQGGRRSARRFECCGRAASTCSTCGTRSSTIRSRASPTRRSPGSFRPTRRSSTRVPFRLHEPEPIVSDARTRPASRRSSGADSSKTGTSPSAAEAATGLIEGNPIVDAIVQRRAATRCPRSSARWRPNIAAALGDRPVRCPLRALVFSARRP